MSYLNQSFDTVSPDTLKGNFMEGTIIWLVTKMLLSKRTYIKNVKNNNIGLDLTSKYGLKAIKIMQWAVTN